MHKMAAIEVTFTVALFFLYNFFLRINPLSKVSGPPWCIFMFFNFRSNKK